MDGVVDQLCSEVKDCEVEFLDLLVGPLGWLEDCPFSLLHWVKEEVRLDESFVKKTERILLQMYLCPSVIHLGAENLLAGAFWIQTSNGNLGKLGAVLNQLFAITEEEVKHLSIIFDQEARLQPVEVLKSDFPDFSQNFTSIESMFNEDELSFLTRHHRSENSKPINF